MKNNILVLSAGRRVELIQSFQESILKLGVDSLVFTTDIQPKLSPACMVSDKSFSVPRVTDSDYINVVLELCLNNDVKLVIPTIDTELLLLSKNKARFEELGIKLVISSVELISNCRDKRLTGKWFESLNIDTPLIFNKDSINFPCFCKPYDGSCSKGAIALSSQAELTQDLINDPKNMFMELVPKTFSEYTIDAYYSNDSRLKCLVPRKRLEVRSGEISKGVTRKNFVYHYLLERVEYLEGARGCITFQLFVNESSRVIKGLEVNPRFGGGYPLSDAAGANFTKWLIEEYILNKELLFIDDWQPNKLMLRYDAKVLQNDFPE